MPQQLPPMIPREALFGNPYRTMPKISPDGASLAWLAPDEGVLNVWIKELGGATERVITRDKKRGIRNFMWAYDNRHLLYTQDLDGDENWHIWSVEPATGIVRDLTPFQGAQSQVVAVDPAFPDKIIVSINARDPRLHDVYLLDLNTGGLVMLVENPGDVVGWLADSTFAIRGADAATSQGGFELRVRDTGEEPWRTIVTWNPEEEGSAYGFTEDDEGIYLESSIGSDMVQFRKLDITTGEETVLASHPRVDLSDVIFHPVDKRPQAVGFNEDKLEWTILDPSIARDMEILQKAHAGELHLISRTLKDDLWIALYTRDIAPASFYVYNRDTGETDFLFTTRPDLENAVLAEMRPVRFLSRDGLDIHAYLTMPRDINAENLPLVLNVHGGPWARDVWGYHSEAQWLANRGYACLQVNFRGSTGYGKKFLHAGDREWGAKMHDDLMDAVQWAIDEGMADPKRIGIYGGSYGGYAALVGAAFTPDTFACSIDVVGPSNITTLIRSIPPYWEPMRRIFTLRVGDPDTEEEFLNSRSPLFKASDIKCPLLIAQGANDPRVKQAESEQIVDAMRECGNPVEYLLYPDEGHGFARPENRLSFYAAAEKFLAKYLGGRVE